jgi:hypothetical protein
MLGVLGVEDTNCLLLVEFRSDFHTTLIGPRLILFYDQGLAEASGYIYLDACDPACRTAHKGAKAF